MSGLMTGKRLVRAKIAEREEKNETFRQRKEEQSETGIPNKIWKLNFIKVESLYARG